MKRKSGDRIDNFRDHLGPLPVSSFEIFESAHPSKIRCFPLSWSSGRRRRYYCALLLSASAYAENTFDYGVESETIQADLLRFH